MSIPDGAMPDYFEFAPDAPADELARITRGLADSSLPPRDAKRRLAREIVRMWHGAEAATAAEEGFDRVFRAKDTPEEMPEVRLPGLRAGARDVLRRKAVRLLVDLDLAKSQSEAKRLISQGGGGGVRVGRRRFARVRPEAS